MKTKPHLIAAFLLVVCFIAACNQESDCDVDILHYASSQLKSNTEPIYPLTGRDTLKFLYNNKDTQVYVGQGVQSGWKLIDGGDPTICDDKYEYLIYAYDCISTTNFNFRVEYYPYRASINPIQDLKMRCYFKNVYVGDYLVSSFNDSVEINKRWYYEPNYISNGPDTFQYFMLSQKQKNADVYFLKIKYLNNELTLLK